MSEESEEKTLPASQRKLRKAREKGQVVTAKDALSSLVASAALVYLYAMRGPIAEQMRALWTLEPAFEGQSFALQLQAKAEILWSLGLGLVLPLFGLVIGIGVLGGILVAGGPVFSLEPMAPKFEKINPAGGFKKIFGRRAFVTFLMNVVRFAMLAVVFTLVLLGGWQALMLAPVCGLGCAMDALTGIVQPLLIAAVAVMLLMALFDYLVQRAEFLREQKMSISEHKRELKDMLGDPQMRGQMRADRREMVNTPTGAGMATLVVTAGSKAAVGLRYRQGETPAPVIVARAKGAAAITMLKRKSGAYVEDDRALVDALRTVRVGGYVTDDDLITALAPLLQRATMMG